MSALVELQAAAPVLGDGGLGTALIARGLPLGRAPESWNLERPEQVAQVHTAFVEAGSQLVQTNTFGANRARLEAQGLDARLEDVNRAGVRLARRAGARWVAGSLGPTGWPASADPARVVAIYAEQAALLAAGGVDLLIVETMTSLAEARWALEGARSAALPVLVSLVVSDALRTLADDLALGEACGVLAAEGAAGLGLNCVGSALALAGLEALGGSGLPTLVAPNAGVPVVHGDRLDYPQGPDDFARDLGAIAAAGATIVAGCCGVAPGHLRALGARLRS